MHEIPAAQFVTIEEQDRIVVEIPVDPEQLEGEHDAKVVADTFGEIVYRTAMDLIRKREREEDRAARRDQE
jgi:hypothetical protein